MYPAKYRVAAPAKTGPVECRRDRLERGWLVNLVHFSHVQHRLRAIDLLEVSHDFGVELRASLSHFAHHKLDLGGRLRAHLAIRDSALVQKRATLLTPSGQTPETRTAASP
jgi:hypothetical protein